MACRFTPKTFAGAWIPFSSTILEGSSGSSSTAMRDTLGNVSLSSSSRLPAKSSVSAASPVMFAPGRAKLAINPLPTGSVTLVMTMGIVLVACWVALAVPYPPAETMISTLSRTSSAASAGRRSRFPSAYRYSMTMFFPSTYPRSRNPCRNASVRVDIAAGELVLRYPIRGTFFGCCACATAPHIASVTTRATIPTNFRFWILDFRLSDRKLGDRIRVLSRICFSPESKTAIENRKLLNDSVRPGQHVRRNCQADLLRRLHIDHQLELRRLFHGQLSRLGAFQNLVDVSGSAPRQVSNAHAVGHEAPVFHKFYRVVYRREPVLFREVCNLFSLRNEDGALEREDLRQHARCSRLGMRSRYPL